MPLVSDAQKPRVEAFQADFAAGLRAVLTALGCKLREGLTPSEVVLAYTNYKYRRIVAHPRTVHWSDTLRARGDLTTEERGALEKIEATAIAGADLYPHQSTSLLDPLSNDGLLADWGIHHLHPGLATGKPTLAPFVNRSKSVLLARITDADMYLIDYLPHGKGVDAPWWNIDLPETLHRNWPDSIADLKIEDYEPKLSWEAHRKLRPPKGATITVAVTVSDGTSYLLSHGMVLSGHSMAACSLADQYQNRVVRIALDRADHEKLIVTGDHRQLDVRVVPR